MQSIFDSGPWPPCPAPFNFAAHVLGRARDLPDKVALAVLGPESCENWSYAELEAAVRGTGTGLLQAGLKPGQIVLMRLGNNVEFPIAYLGAMAVGLVPVPTSTQLTEPEVAKMIDTLQPAAILHAEGVACPQTDIPVINQDALEAMRELAPCEWDMGDPNRLAYVIFTSGTSGNARAVMHAHRAIWARGMMHEGWYGLSENDRLCHAGAFNWTYTLGTGLMDPWSVGATALIPAPGTQPEQLPALLKRHGATIFAAAPGVYRKILNTQNGPLDLPDLRHGLSAGEKLSESIRRGWNEATGKNIYEAFGMSECSTFISGAPGRPARPGSLGLPQEGRRLAVVDDDGQPVPIGEDGTIAVSNRDPGLMLGYLGAEDETRARFRGEWFLTGDHGSMGKDGQIDYHARVDDMMNAGGYRVSPLEVENALQGFPGIGEIGVTDVEVKADARIIAAFYTADAPLDHDALAKYAAERLARYKQPRLFVHLKSLPRNANGKLQRQALKPLAGV